MDKLYEEKRRITYYDLDCKGRLKLSALLRIVHIAADNDAKGLGIGFLDLAPLSMSFVLQRFGLAINRMPVYDEPITIRTWPASIERGIFLRKGIMAGDDGKPYMEWTSMWVLFDIAARKILRPNALPTTIPCVGSQGVEVPVLKNNLTGEWGDRLTYYQHKVRYSEVDTNMHMNNSIYGDLINNVLYMDEKKSPASDWRRLQLNYLNETKMGELIEVECKKNGDTYLVTGKTEDKNVFSAVVNA